VFSRLLDNVSDSFFRPGAHQAPRTTWRHWPLLPAAITAAALAAAAFFMSSAGPVPLVRAVRVHALVRAAGSRTQMESLLPQGLRQGRTAVVAAAPPAPDPRAAMQLARNHLTAEVAPTSYVVRHGDTLSSVAKRYYGSARLWRTT
jgi:nucleoid-associated protein YgaU